MPRISGTLINDTLVGTGNRDRIFGDYGNDVLQGAAGNDRLDGGRGNDRLQGGDGNDVIRSRADAGEAVIAQNINANNDPNGEVNAAARMIYPKQAGLPSDDILTGGAGADEFRIETLISAKADIIRKHVDPNTGVIDWMGVAGENNLVHDHWVDSIGNDVITDFNRAEGDTLSIKGHTTEVFKIDLVDADGDGAADDSVLHLRSNQGAGGGAHNLDLLGTLTVLNNEITANDFATDANVAYGIVDNISQLNEAINPGNPGAGNPAPNGNGYGHPLNDLLAAPAGAAVGTPATAGDDVMVCTDGNDTEFGLRGNDLMLGMAGDDTMNGGRGDDRLDGGVGNDRLMGGRGKDLLAGGEGDDSLGGGDGNDMLIGMTGADTIDGGAGRDSLFGGLGDDILQGGSGNDVFMGGAGSDQISGGSGRDALLLSGNIADYTVAVARGRVSLTDADGATDTVTGVEQFRFLGSGETYVVRNGALTATTNTSGLDTQLADHMMEDLIALETGEAHTDDPVADSDPGAGGMDMGGMDMGGMAGMNMYGDQLAA